jgi:acetamidase/formamidase
MSKHQCGVGCTDESHEQEIQTEFTESRRGFMKEIFVGGATASLTSLAACAGPSTTFSGGRAGVKREEAKVMHYYLPANAETVHWGYFSKLLKPLVEVESGDFVTIEALTHHANDDAERMIKGDSGVESVFYWDKQRKGVNRRGAGPMDHKLGAGGGLGVHICTGPVAVRGAEPGDVLEVRILDTVLRESANPQYRGRAFGSCAAANWGFHYKDQLEEPKLREVVTIFEVDTTGERNWARAVYNYRWTPQTDPFGVTHPIIDYPGVPVDHRTIKKNENILKDFRVPVRPHFGVMGLAPAESDIVTSIPPSYTGGNIDNWRIGKGATMYYPVAVPKALFSIGDSHASQGDSELCGTAIECSLTGTFQLVLHKKADIANSPLANLEYPLLETKDDWLVHGFSYPNYLQQLGPEAQSEIYTKSSVDLAMRDAFRKMRHFLMLTQKLTEDEAVALMSVAVDFGVTQVVDGNWGVHAIVKKEIFPSRFKG